MNSSEIFVDSEIAHLQRVIVHSPDSGLGKVVPSKAQDWLFEDIIHLDIMRREEYDYFIKILLYFLDPEKVKGKITKIDDPSQNRGFYKPDSADYFASDKVIDPQSLLVDILQNEQDKALLVASIGAVERCPFSIQRRLLQLPPQELAKSLISGSLPDGKLIFPPVPNFIFTRDIGIVIKDHILLNRPAKLVRIRESLIMKYIFFKHPYFADYQDKIIEIGERSEHQFFISEEDKSLNEVTVEGGDVMTISPEQVLIGWSERTSIEAINQVIKALFAKDVVRKVSVIKIPAKRDFMHIDTVFTQVKRDLWVLFGALSKHSKEFGQDELLSPLLSDKSGHQPRIWQFEKGKTQPKIFSFLEDLLVDVSKNDLGVEGEVNFVYSGGNIFPFELREQWTDACNVLAIREGVIIGYDRNTKTAEEFAKKGFDVVKAKTLLDRFEAGEASPETLKDTLIMLPSAELSRARGGSHCMSMPLLRMNYK